MLAFAPTILWHSSTSGNIQLTPENITNVLLGKLQNQPDFSPISASVSNLNILWGFALLLLISGIIFFSRELKASYEDKPNQLSNEDKVFLESISVDRAKSQTHQAA